MADTDNFTIREVIPSTGAVSTLAGLAGTSGSTDGTGSAARFFHPAGIAVDSNSNLYIADTDNHTVRLGLSGNRRLDPDSAAKPDGDCGQQRPVLCGRLGASGGDLSMVLRRHGDQRRDGSSYSLSSAQSSNAGNYTVVVSNVVGSVTSNVATLTVNSAGGGGGGGGSAGGGGGGGLPSTWFCGALILLPRPGCFSDGRMTKGLRVERPRD